MRSDRRRTRAAGRSVVARIACAIALIGALVGTGPNPAAAHANLLAAAPGPGQEVGGVVGRVQMIFDEPITDLEIVFTGPDGGVIETTLVTVGPQQFDVEFDPLQAEGLYVVSYTFVSLDTDFVTLGFAFSYAVDGPSVVPLSAPTVLAASDGPPTAVIVTVAVGAIAVGVLAGQLVRRRRALARLRT